MLLGLALGGCTDLQARIELRAAADPDPFDDVRWVQVWAETRDNLVQLDPVRWDQGPVSLRERVPIEARRMWVVGLNDDGVVVSSAPSPPLDLVAEPPARLELELSRVGALSRATEDGVLPARHNARAVSWGGGVLVVGGTVASTPELPTTFLDRFGRPASEAPVLPEPLTPLGVAHVGNTVVLFGTPRTWLLLPDGTWSSVENPVETGTHPAVVPREGRRALLMGADGVGEIDVADRKASYATTRPVSGPARFLAWRQDQALVATSTVLTVYDPSGGGLQASPRIRLQRSEPPEVAVTPSGAVAMAGGAEGLFLARLGVLTTTIARLSAAVPSAPSAVFSAEGWLVAAGRSGAVVAVDLVDVAGVPSDVGAPFVLAPHSDGTLRGASEAGAAVVFNPGPFGRHPDALGRGWVPSGPGLWRREGADMVGRGPETTLAQRQVPSWAVLGTRSYRDFEMDVLVAPVGRGSASLLYGLRGDLQEEVVLERSARVRPSGSTRAFDCPTADIPEFDEGRGAVLVRLRRLGPRIELDVGADGVVELSCEHTEAPGRVALAVRDGEVRFSGLRLTAR